MRASCSSAARPRRSSSRQGRSTVFSTTCSGSPDRLGGERRAQDRVSLEQTLPSAAEDRRVEARLESRTATPRGRPPDSRRVHGIEEPLHRRERVHVLEPGMRLGRDAPSRPASSAREREVRRRESRRPWPRCSARSSAAERSRRRRRRRARSSRGSVQRLAEDEARLEPAVAHERQHFERVAPPRARAVPRAGRLRRETEERRARHDLVELAEIVEDQVRLRMRAELRRRASSSPR